MCIDKAGISVLPQMLSITKVVIHRSIHSHAFRANIAHKEATMIQKTEISQRIKSRLFAEERISLSRILVATDFSQTSDRALEHALSVARAYNSRICMANVIPVELMMTPELAKHFRVHIHR